MDNKMDRKEFLKKGFFSLGSLISVSALLDACTGANITSTTNTATGTLTQTGLESCTVAPNETKGPFPTKTPAELVKSNIVSDRAGIPLVIKLKVTNKNNGCKPLSGVKVNLWHCDAEGNYSEYGGTGMQQIDYTNVHFLRGTQTTDENGDVTFISIYPGWYRGRAPHIHLEVIDGNNKSLSVTQIAFPEDTSSTVYATSKYKGAADTTNARDNVFSDSLAANMADSVTGNTTEGYTLSKTIVVNG